MLSTYSRYLFRNWLIHFSLSFIGLCMLLMIGQIVKTGIQLNFLLPILPYLAPSMLIYTIPMATLTSSITVLTGFRSRGEVLTMAASGVQVRQYSYLLLFSGLVLSAITFACFEWIQPEAEKHKRRYLGQLGAKLLEKELKNEHFSIKSGNYSVFIFPGKSQNTKSCVFLIRREGKIVDEGFVQDAHIVLDKERKVLRITRKRVTGLNYSDPANIMPFFTQELTPAIEIPYRELMPYKPSPRFMPLSQMWKKLQSDKNQFEYSKLNAYFHEKISTIFSPFVFVLIAFPLAFLGPRSSRAIGFLIGLFAIFLLYYPIMLTSKKQVIAGLEPAWLLMQSANLFILGFGLFGFHKIDRRV